MTSLVLWYRRNRLVVAVSVIALATAAALILGAFVPLEVQGGHLHTETPESDVQEFVGGGLGWTALAVAAGTILLGWALTGVPLMARLRKHRVGLHTWTSIAALCIAIVHGLALNRAQHFEGTLSGWISTGMMLALFWTGWWRHGLVVRWGLPTWRWVHWLLAIGAVLIGVEHWALIENAKPE